MSIAGDLIRGHTDAIILARLMRGDSYGYAINKTVSRISGREAGAEGGHALYGLSPTGGGRVCGVLLGR